MAGRCMCGDLACPSCGPAQGVDLELAALTEVEGGALEKQFPGGVYSPSDHEEGDGAPTLAEYIATRIRFHTDLQYTSFVRLLRSWAEPHETSSIAGKIKVKPLAEGKTGMDVAKALLELMEMAR